MPLSYVWFVAVTVLCLLQSVVPGYAQINSKVVSPQIIINLPSRTLELYSANTLIKVYPIAIGKPSTPTPTGDYEIFEKEENPWWYKPRSDVVIPSGPNNPLGYRWMEWSPSYGIHGTNNPASIGWAVSNGCIRMHEEDVEEVYDIVPCGTPVKVTYEEDEVRIDGKGDISLGIYPDIYGRHTLTIDEVKRKLAAQGLAGFISEGDLERLISEQAERQVVFAHFYQITVNGRLLADRAVAMDGVLYLPAFPIAAAIGMNLVWDEKSRTVGYDNHSVSAVVKGDRVYVSSVDAQVLFGGQQLCQAEASIWKLQCLNLYLNGNKIVGTAQIMEGIPAVSLRRLADALGQKVTCLPDGSFAVGGKKVPCLMDGEEPYLQITKIYELFQAYVYWDQQAGSIELTYPFTPPAN